MNGAEGKVAGAEIVEVTDGGAYCGCGEEEETGNCAGATAAADTGETMTGGEGLADKAAIAECNCAKFAMM